MTFHPTPNEPTDSPHTSQKYQSSIAFATERRLRLTPKKLSRIILAAGFALAAFLMMPRLSLAATDTWTDAAGTGLWSTPGNWSNGTSPTDIAIFSASSTANVTIDAGNTINLTINIQSGYTGTITQTAGGDQNIITTINQAGGTYIIASGDFNNPSVIGTACLYYMANINLSGGTFIQQGSNQIFAGSINQTGGTFQGGSGNITLYGWGPDLVISSGTFVNTSGLLTMGTGVCGATYDGQFSITGGTFQANGGSVQINDSFAAANVTTSTVLTGSTSSPPAFNNLTIQGGISKAALNGKIAVNGTFTFTGMAWQSSASTSEIDFNGNIVDGSTYLNYYNGTTTTAFVFTGTGNQTFTGSSTYGVVPTIVNNKPSGTLTIQNGMTVAGDFIDNEGGIAFGTSTVVFSPHFTTDLFNPYSRAVQIQGTSTPINFYNVTFSGNSSAPAGITIATGTIVNVSSTFSYTGDSYFPITGGSQINVQGDVSDTNTAVGFNGQGPLGGVTLNGVGDQHIYATATGVDVGVFPALFTINKTSGTVYPVGTLNLSSGWGGGWNQVQGTVNAGTSTVVFANGYANPCGGVGVLNGNTQFNKLEILGGWCAITGSPEPLTVGTSSTPVVNGTLTLTCGAVSGGCSPGAGGMPAINGGTIQVNGNIVAAAPSGEAAFNGGGSGTIAVTGTSTQTFTDNLGTYWQLPQLLVNAPNKTALLGYGSFLLGSTTIQQGEFWIPSSTLNATATLSLAGNVAITSAGALRVFQPSSTITNASTSNVTVTNNGFVHVDAPFSGCGQSSTVVLAGGASNKQIIWAGSGKNIFRYVKASYQTASGTAITAVNSTNGGNNTNWNFTSNQPPPQLVQMQSATAQENLGGVKTATMPWGVRPGDTLVVAVTNDEGGSAAPTDNVGNTYTLVTSTVVISPGDGSDIGNGGGGYYYTYLYYAKNVTGTAPFNITVGFSGGGVMEVLDYTGVSPSSTLETYNEGTVPQFNAKSGNINTSFPDDLYIAVGNSGECQGWPSLTSPFTTEMGINATTDGCVYYIGPGLAIGDFIASTTQFLSVTASSSGESAIIAAFRGAIVMNYPPLGVLDSATFDTRGQSQFNSLTWRGTTPGGVGATSVSFQLAVSNSSNGPWNFVGPDGTANTFFTGNSGTPIPLQSCSLLSSCYLLFNNYRYFRYRVTLTSNGSVTPTVTNIVINWSR